MISAIRYLQKEGQQIQRQLDEAIDARNKAREVLLGRESQVKILQSQHNEITGAILVLENASGGSG